MSEKENVKQALRKIMSEEGVADPNEPNEPNASNTGTILDTIAEFLTTAK